MRLTYQLSIKDKAEQEIANDFCSYLIDVIKREIRYKLFSIPYNKLKNYEDVLLKSEVVSWNTKPTSLNIYNVFNILLDRLTFDICKEFKYSIHFKNVLFNNTDNSIDSIVRLLDKGNEEYIGLFIIGNTFSDIERKINDHWKLYVYKRLKRISVSKVVILK